MIWIFAAFFYFIIVNIFVFTRQWNLLIVTGIAGFVLLLIYMFSRTGRSRAAAPATNSDAAARTGEKTPETEPTDPREDTTIPFIFFFSELVIIFGLILVLVLGNKMGL